MDLVKAFERVQLVHVWKWGLYYGFPKALLAMVLTYFGYARRLVVDGCYTESLETCTAIVAGSRFSVCILRLMEQWPGPWSNCKNRGQTSVSRSLSTTPACNSDESIGGWP